MMTMMIGMTMTTHIYDSILDFHIEWMCKHITYNTGDQIWYYIDDGGNMVVIQIITHDNIYWNIEEDVLHFGERTSLESKVVLQTSLGGGGAESNPVALGFPVSHKTGRFSNLVSPVTKNVITNIIFGIILIALVIAYISTFY